MNTERIEDLKEIRRIMESSVRFLYVSGTSMLLIGLIALGGIAIHLWHYGIGISSRIMQPSGEYSKLPDESAWTNRIWETNLAADRLFMLETALGVLFLSLVIVFLFSLREVKKNGARLWTSASRQLLLHFGFPLFMSGLICLRFLNENQFFLLPGLSLMLYGICLLSASKFTFRQMSVLAVVEIFIGLVGLYFPETGVICWALGFGIAHIIFGGWMNLNFRR